MITRLHVRNFKSLRELDMHLGLINVLVGPNMAGKSNILDALRFLYEIVFPKPGMDGVSFALAQRGGANEVLWKGGDESLITLAVEVTDSAEAGTEYRYELQLLVGRGGFATTQNESLKVVRSGSEHDLIAVKQGFLWQKNFDGKELGGIGTNTTALQNATLAWDVSISEQGLKRPTSVWQASDGFLALTALLSLVYVPPERGGTLYCVEEPENHLHPRLLEALVALLRQAQGTNGSQAQFLFATQSPYFVDQFSLDELYWVEKKKGETKAFRLADKTELRKTVEDKVLGLGNLMYSGALGKE